MVHLTSPLSALGFVFLTTGFARLKADYKKSLKLPKNRSKEGSWDGLSGVVYF